jgi:hypothetical protein
MTGMGRRRICDRRSQKYGTWSCREWLWVGLMFSSVVPSSFPVPTVPSRAACPLSAWDQLGPTPCRRSDKKVGLRESKRKMSTLNPEFESFRGHSQSHLLERHASDGQTYV